MARAVDLTNRRRTELGLIVMVIIITLAAYVLATLGETSDLPVNIVPFLCIVVGLFLAAHLAMRRFAPNADPILLPLAALLNGLGYVVIASIDPQIKQPLAPAQAMWTAIGVGAFIGTLIVVRNPKVLQRYRYTFLLIGFVLLVLPFIPGIGSSKGGARIWASVGPINFQPGEVTKIVLAIFFAAYLVDKRELLRTGTRRIGPFNVPDLKYLGPVLLIWFISLVVMVAQTDFGTSLLFFSLFVVLLWVATERPSWLVIGTILFIAGAVFAWTQFGHVQTRVDMWLDPWQDPQGKGLQVIGGSYAMAFGGLTGTGLGMGGNVFVPLVSSDFIFASIGEQLGLLGGTLVLITYLLMVGSGLRVAIGARDTFEKLLATGLTALLGIQAFIIVGGVTRVLPLTGVTLPFVSYGGSSLVANYVLLALLLRVSDDSSTPEPAVEADPAPERVALG